MLDWLYDLSDARLLSPFAGMAAAGFLAAPLLGQRLGCTAGDKDLDYVGRAQMSLTSLAAVVLSFSLIQVDGNLRRAGELVEREAAQIDYCDRLMLRDGEAQTAALRPLLWSYAESLVKDEWPALQADRDSLATGEMLVALSRAAAAFDAQPGRQMAIYGDFLRALDALADYRTQRLAMAKSRLPDIFWYLNLAVILLMLGLSLMIPATPQQVFAGVARGLAVALLAGVVFTIDTPLKGESAVAPTAIEKALAAVLARS